MAHSTTIQNSEALSAPRLQSHLPSLDGMRAISILFVLTAHSADAISRSNNYTGYLGKIGVSIFFVISGLLITWLMIRERDATGTFSLRNFYIRRFLRILPVFWLLLLSVSALNVMRIVPIPWIVILRAFTFTANYPVSPPNPGYSVWLYHTWSLSLEEQFYLVWPSLFAFLRPRHAARLAAILVVAGPLLRLLNYYCLPAFRGQEWGMFHTRIDILMAGCASAFLLESPAWCARIRRIPVWPALATTSFFLLVAEPVLTGVFRPHSIAEAVTNLIIPTLEALAIALTLLIVVAGKQALAFRILNWRISTFIGKLSYSIYIWQQPIIERPLGMTASPFVLAERLLTVSLVSFCSFNFFERPFIKLRSKFRHGVSV